MACKTGKRQKGFTLVELIVTLTILAILAAVAVPTGIRYMENAKQTARDKAARSIFLAAQKALTSRMSAGDKLTMLEGDPVDVSEITPAFSDVESAEDIVYLSIDQSDPEKEKHSSSLYMLLEPYLADKDLLNHTVLIEFNKQTGKAYSAFYSEEVSGIGYGGNLGGDTYNAYKRSEKNRKDGRMGYWGVDSTGGLDGDEENVQADIQMVDYDGSGQQGNAINEGNNYGLLTVECTLPSAAELAKVDTLTITLIGNSQESITIKNDPTGQIENVITLSQVEQRLDVSAALENPFKVQAGDTIKNYPLYIDHKDDGSRILVWVLDSQAEGMGYYENHEALGTGTITAEMKLAGTGTEKDQTFSAEPVHGLFGREYSDDGRTAYEIRSVRHLNNIRYTASDEAKVYVQTEDIICRDYRDAVISWEPIGEQGPMNPVKKWEHRWGETHGFAGTYKGEKHSINDLTVEASKNYGMAGLFSCISAKGTVSQLELDYTKAYWTDNGLEGGYFITGVNRVGGIAGENWGVIEKCTIQGKIRATGGEAKAGGVAGKLMCLEDSDEAPGIITQCVSAATVTADSQATYAEGGLAGGIVGDCYGVVTYCESGTAISSLRLGGVGVQIDGTPYFGVTTNVSSGNMGDYDDAVNDAVTISGSRSAGGIAGQLRGSEWGRAATIQGCVNAAKVTSPNGNAGGICGRYSRFAGSMTDKNGSPVRKRAVPIRIVSSYNAGSVSGCFHAGGIAGEYILNGTEIVEEDKKNEIRICYNTGSISGLDSRCEAIAGIAGRLGAYTALSDCYNVGTIGTGLNAKKADGIFAQIWNEGSLAEAKSSCENCIARKDKDPKIGFATGGDNGREFIQSEKLENGNNSLVGKGFDRDEKTVGPFDYPYPYFSESIIDKDGVCRLGSNFHRTPPASGQAEW